MVVRMGKKILSASSLRSKVVFQYTLKKKFVNFFPSLYEASQQTGFDESGIQKCACGMAKSYRGYLWKYVN